jgi:hypothetical protein
VSDDWDAEEQAIARALDAASDAETRGADPHLVDEYRAVLGAMAVREVAPRAELEDRVVAAALQRRPATVPTLDRARARRLSPIRLAALGAATVAAAIVIGLLVHGSSTSPTPGGRISLATQQRTNVDALVRAPGSRTATLSAGNGRVVIARSGDAAVYGLSSDAAASVGLVSAGGTTTLGPAQPTGGTIAFTVDHPERVTAVTLSRNGAVVARAVLTPG